MAGCAEGGSAATCFPCLRSMGERVRRWPRVKSRREGAPPPYVEGRGRKRPAVARMEGEGGVGWRRRREGGWEREGEGAINEG